AFQLFASRLVRFVDERRVGEVQQVENHEGHGNIGATWYPMAPFEAHALLEGLEAGLSLLIEPDDLTVEDGPSTAECLTETGELRVAPGDLNLVPGHEAELALLDECQTADAVPFHFVGPALVIPGQGAREPGQHGWNPLRHRISHGQSRRL